MDSVGREIDLVLSSDLEFPGPVLRRGKNDDGHPGIQFQPLIYAAIHDPGESCLYGIPRACALRKDP